ncbi:MFS transporter [Streptomyces sp. NPDC001205]
MTRERQKQGPPPSGPTPAATQVSLRNAPASAPHRADGPVPGASPAPAAGAALAVLCAGALVIGLDTTILNIALPTLQRQLHTSFEELQWIADSFPLALACLVLPAAMWADRHGQRRALMFGLSLCAGAALYGALAPRAGHVIVARLAMGTAGALLMPPTLALITRLHPQGIHRTRAIGLWCLAFAGGGMLGPTAGGYLIEHCTWRAGFWINLPPALAILAAARRYLPAHSSHRADAPVARHSTPWAAVLLLPPLVWAIIEAPQRGWSDPTIASAMSASVLLGTGLALHRLYRRPRSLTATILRHPRFTAAILSLLCVCFTLFGTLFVINLHLNITLGYTPAQAGLRTLPLLAGSALGVLTCLLIGWYRPKQRTWCQTGGLAVLAASFILPATLPADAGYRPVLAFQLLAGAGGAMTLPFATETVMTSLPPQHAGFGAALNDILREVGAALGIAAFSTALTTRYDPRRPNSAHGLTDGLHSAALIGLATATLTLLLTLTLDHLPRPRTSHHPTRPAAPAGPHHPDPGPPAQPNTGSPPGIPTPCRTQPKQDQTPHHVTPHEGTS